MSEPIHVVVMSVGETYSPRYVERFASMLSRHADRPYRLSCVVDRPIPLPKGVTPIDASGWDAARDDMNLTSYKLGLLSSELMPFREFFFFDTSEIIRRSMKDVFDFALSAPQDLVCVDDWGYECYNTCAMRIRPGGVLECVWREFKADMRYPFLNPVDQDFLYQSVKANGWESYVTFFPPEMIASYKVNRDLGFNNLAAANAAIEAATIVKFHGQPKPVELVSPKSRLRALAKKILGRKPGSSFWVEEAHRLWR